MEQLGARGKNAIEGVLFALIAVVVFWIVARIVKAIFKRKIDSKRYYTIAVVVGFLLHRVVIIVLQRIVEST
jgi:hypothetical protein